MRATLVLLMVLSGVSCVFDFRPPSPHVGSYELSTGCVLEVEAEQATASCGTAGTSVDVSFGTGLVTFTRIVVTDTVTNSDCWQERVCTRTYSGSATRSGGEPDTYGGRLGRFAGTWSGSLAMKVACSKEVAKSGAPTYCKNARKDVTYSFTATVTAKEGKVTWTGSDGAAGDFKALETKGGVRVADTFYKRLGEPAPSADKGTTPPVDYSTPEWDKGAGDQATKDQAVKDKAAPDKGAGDQTVKDQAVSDQAVKDQAAGDQTVKDQAVSDQAVKDQAVSDQVVKDQVVKDQAVPDQAAKDHAATDVGATDRSASPE